MTHTNPLKLAYARHFPAEVAAHLSRRGGEETVQTLEGLPDDAAAVVVARLGHGHAIRVLSGQDDSRIAGWLGAASLDHALAILLHIDAVRRPRILDALPNRGTRRALRQLAVYPVGTVGAALNPAALRLDAGILLREAFELLRSDEPEAEQAIWLVDGEGNYRGRLDLLRTLAAHSDHSRLGEFLVPVKPLRAETTLVNVRDYGDWLEHSELPVIDEVGHLLGSITHGRLVTALGPKHATTPGLADGISELVRQYFRIMGICLGNLFAMRGTRR